MANSNKDVVYIDADEEITGIIDKVRSAEKQLVALVLPKRASMLQSSVNMKLLKKSADKAKKHVVLVTTESNLLPLAGSVGLYVARNLDSKPEVPVGSSADDEKLNDLVASDEPASEEDFNPEEVGDKSLGELANLPAEEPKMAAAKKVKPELAPLPIPRGDYNDEDETIELDNTDVPEQDLAAAAAETAKSEKPKKAKSKLRVPNFEKFRLRLFLVGALIILLIFGFVFANTVLPRATVTIATKTSPIATNLTLNVSTTAQQVDINNSTIPAHAQQDKKTQSQQVSTTGQKNEGQTASGSVTISEPCSDVINTPQIPAGTGLSANGLTFITQSSVNFNTYSNAANCGFGQSSSASGTTNVVAQQPGTQYNLNNATFAVSGYSSASGSGSTSGGTDKIVQVVSQTDIQNAQQKLGSVDTNAEKSALQSALQQAGYYALPGTFSAGKPSISTSANVGDQATSVTVTQTIVYTMFGVHKSDLLALINNNVNSQINTSTQAIVDNGLSNASFSVAAQSGSGAQVNMQDTASVGPKIDVTSLKKQIEGKKSGNTEAIINNIPGVSSVNVHLSPFWVSSVPKNPSKITITIKKS